MRGWLGSALAASILLASASAAAATAGPTGPRDPREQVPPTLIGAWKADIAASNYPSTPPAFHVRTFEYTRDGMLLVTFMGRSANGQQSSGHWAVQVDGTPGIEYTRATGSNPYQVVTLKKVDDRNFEMNAGRNGTVLYRGTYQLSPDGQTLTYSYTYDNARTTVVYRRWDMAD